MTIRLTGLLCIGLAATCLPPVTRATAQTAQLTPTELRAALDTKPTGPAAAALADRLRSWFGGRNLMRGPNPRIEGLTAAWAVELPGATEPPTLTVEDGFTTLGNLTHPDTPEVVTTTKTPFQRVGDTNVYAVVLTRPEGDAFRWSYRAGDHDARGQAEVYAVRQDSVPNPAVPHGTLTKEPPWHSHIFEGTTRDWWVYVPAQYKPEDPACVMVFQDGGGYTSYVPTVFDNLIAKGDMPVTVGIFINPGTRADGKSDRSFEYDTLSDQYARFLLAEILPEVEKTVKLRHDPASRAIAGASSGGICAFTVAWERPSEFSKVLSWVGSFTNIANGPDFKQGGHNYEAMIRKAPVRPIRVFLQDGLNDLDNANGDWPLAGMTLAKSLAFRNYDYKYVLGRGFHSASHGRAILPDSLRWLWRDYKP